MVEKSNTNSLKRKRINSYINDFTLDEIDVAKTLINLLPSLNNKSNNSHSFLYSFFQFSYAWGVKRPRSAVVNSPPPCTVALPPPSSAVTTTVVKSSSTSPDTPLGLSTVCDGFYYNNKKFDISIKKAKDKLEKMIEERLLTQLTLKEKIEKVKQHLEKLKVQNCELKLEKDKLMEKKSAVNGTTLQAGPSTSKVYKQQPPLISHHQVYFPNQTVDIQPYFGRYRELGPRGFDLNVSAEEMGLIENELQPLDHQEEMIRNVMMNRAIAAQARHNRIIINKSKKVTRVK